MIVGSKLKLVWAWHSSALACFMSLKYILDIRACDELDLKVEILTNNLVWTKKQGVDRKVWSTMSSMLWQLSLHCFLNTGNLAQGTIKTTTKTQKDSEKFRQLRYYDSENQQIVLLRSINKHLQQCSLELLYHNCDFCRFTLGQKWS